VVGRPPRLTEHGCGVRHQQWVSERHGGIRQLADVVAGRARLSAVMEVRISLDQSEPPVGRVTVTSPRGVPATHSSVPFTGWLGLLRALSDVLGASGDAPPGS